VIPYEEEDLLGILVKFLELFVVSHGLIPKDRHSIKQSQAPFADMKRFIDLIITGTKFQYTHLPMGQVPPPEI